MMRALDSLDLCCGSLRQEGSPVFEAAQVLAHVSFVCPWLGLLVVVDGRDCKGLMHQVNTIVILTCWVQMLVRLVDRLHVCEVCRLGLQAGAVRWNPLVFRRQTPTIANQSCWAEGNGCTRGW